MFTTRCGILQFVLFMVTSGDMLEFVLILFAGCELSEHQELAGFDVSDSG